MVWIVDAEEINAGSLGDRRFVIWTGLARLPHWAIDGVFAHEIAHDLMRHSRRASELRDLTDWIGSALGVFSEERSAQTLRHWTGKLILPVYNRRQELEADSVAALVLMRAGYNDGMDVEGRTLELLKSEIGEAGGGFFSSHPALTERIRRLERTDARDE